MRKRTITVLVGLVIMICLPLSVHSQTYWNLEPIWVKAEPETCTGYGVELASGDLNGDGFSDIVTGYFDNTNWIVRTWIFFSNPLDTIVDIVLNRYPGSPVISDVNGDGFGDLIFFYGKMRIYFGGNPMDTVPDVVIGEPPGSSSFGCSITSGDVSGDGIKDLIVGAENTKVNGINDVGRVYIYYGGADIDTIPDIILNGDTVYPGLFGHLVSSGFDLNGDGNIDLAVNAIWDNFSQGRVYIYYGGNSASPMDTIPDLVIWGTRPGDFFGDPMAITGDLNGDGFGDLVVGEPLEATHDTVFIYYGGSPMDSTVDVVLSGKDGTRFGNAVSGNHRVNSDVYYDLQIGAPLWELQGVYGKGRVFVYCGNDPFPTTPSAFATGEYNSQEIGWRVASAGDVDGDGTDEIMFSNYAGYGKKVWVCRYTGAGITEQGRVKREERREMTVSPTPFSTSTTILLTLPSIGAQVEDTELKIYDIIGRLVKSFSLVSPPSSLFLSVSWDGKDEKGNEVRSGIYFVKLKVKGEGVEKEKVRKVIKVK